jgi:hypothetical protein
MKEKKSCYVDQAKLRSPTCQMKEAKAFARQLLVQNV